MKFKGNEEMSTGPWTKGKKLPEPSKQDWRVGDKVEINEGESRIRGTILEVYPKYLLILTGYGYRTCINRAEAEKRLKKKT